jgi:hypothetical protein
MKKERRQAGRKKEEKEKEVRKTDRKGTKKTFMFT